jgi:hypothetical protein
VLSTALPADGHVHFLPHHAYEACDTHY